MNQKGFAHILVLIILLIGVVVGVYLVTHPQIFKSRAIEEIPSYATGQYGSTPENMWLQFPKMGSSVKLMAYLSDFSQITQYTNTLFSQFNDIWFNKGEDISYLQSAYPMGRFHTLTASSSSLLNDVNTATEEAGLLKDREEQEITSFYAHRMYLNEGVFKNYISTMSAVLDRNKTLALFIQPQLFKSSDPNFNYQNNLSLERFYLASFLLFQKPNLSYFGYHPGTPFNTTSGIYFYRDWSLDFGNPISNYSESSGVYKRLYQKGLVVVNSTSTAQNFSFPNTSLNYRAWDQDQGPIIKGSTTLPAKNGAFYFVVTLPSASPSTSNLVPTASTSVSPAVQANNASSPAALKNNSSTTSASPTRSPNPTSSPSPNTQTPTTFPTSNNFLNSGNFVPLTRTEVVTITIQNSAPPAATQTPQADVVNNIFSSVQSFNQNLTKQVENILKVINFLPKF